MPPRPADEHPHPPGPDPDWEESWHFDFAASDGSLGGFVRLVLRPGDGVAWYWAYLVGPRRPVIAVRDHELEPPARLRGPNALTARDLEVRGPGLWAQVVCETALDHWSAGLEASGVALDDPAEGLRGERGQPVPLGLDLEWEASGAPAGDEAGYVLPAVVHGEVLAGAERWDLDGVGWWTHRWGQPQWRDDGWWWAAGTFDDGRSMAAAAPGPGWEWTDGHDREPAELGPVSLSLDALTATQAAVGLSRVAWAVVPLPGGRGLARDLCAWALGDRRGWGWSERLQAAAP